MLVEAVNWSPEWKKKRRKAIAVLAASARIRRISLSVERKNFAQKLYLSEGCQVVGSSDANSDTMVKDLTAPGRPARP